METSCFEKLYHRGIIPSNLSSFCFSKTKMFPDLHARSNSLEKEVKSAAAPGPDAHPSLTSSALMVSAASCCLPGPATRLCSPSAAPTSSSKCLGFFNSRPWQDPKQTETALPGTVDLSPPRGTSRTNYLASSWSLLSLLSLVTHCALRLDEGFVSLESIWNLTI